MNARTSDIEAKRFEETEKRLVEWGNACREGSSALGLPTISGIAAMIAHVRRQDRLAKGIRKKKLRQARKAWKSGDAPVDARDVAEELGYAEKALTAEGKEKGSFRPAPMTLSSSVAITDSVVSQLPNWAQKCINRSYKYGQPDRKAAEELCMPQGEYAQRRRAAVFDVAARLEQRYSASVSRRGD